MESRLQITGEVTRLIAWLEHPPSVLISASAVGWYGANNDTDLTEGSEGLPSFGNDVCSAWEAAAREAERYGVRVVLLRLGIVFGIEGGMLSQLLAPFEYGLGARIGSGRQFMSWIERDDAVRLIAHAIARPDVSGVVNATTPNPVTNAEFTRELAHALRRPAYLRIPGLLLHYAAGDLADELLLGSKRVMPVKALAAGFEFHHPTLRGALSAILGGKKEDILPADSEYPRLPVALRHR